MSLYFLSIPPKKLSQSITSSSSSFKLNNIKSWKRNALGVTINLASSDFGTTAYGCFRNDTGTKIEIFAFDPATIASSSITILKRGLDFNGDLTTETTNYKLDWSANETTVQLGTDVPQLFQYLKEYIDAAAIAAAVPASTTAAGIVVEASQAEVNAFTDTKVVSSVTYKIIATPAKLQATTANKGIVRLSTAPVSAAEPIAVGDNDLRIANASTTAYGIVEEATAAEVAAKTAIGGTGARLFVNPSTLSLPPTQQIFTTTGAGATYTKPTGLSAVIVEVVGGGGGGGGNTTSNRGGGGGGGGGYSRKLILAASLGATETVVAGAGGAGATAGTGTTGSTSSFGTHATATGGVGGESNSIVSLGGAGGVGASGNINAEGGDGGGGFAFDTSSGTTIALGGNGGNSFFGAGAGIVTGLGSVEGISGNLYGGGGSGSSNTNNANTTGGTGGQGVVMVTEYY